MLILFYTTQQNNTLTHRRQRNGVIRCSVSEIP